MSAVDVSLGSLHLELCFSVAPLLPWLWDFPCNHRIIKVGKISEEERALAGVGCRIRALQDAWVSCPRGSPPLPKPITRKWGLSFLASYSQTNSSENVLWTESL